MHLAGSLNLGSGTVVNDVEMLYSAFAQLTADYQSHSGAVNTATTPKRPYSFADGSANTVRVTMRTYPNGRNLTYDYGAGGGVNDALSRVGTLFDNDGVTHLADYSYLGLGGVVEVNSPQPQLKYTLIGTAGGNDPDTGDIYRGLDRFGRVKDLLWYNYGSSTNVKRVQHGYDRASNRVYRADPVDASDQHDEFYSYDGLYRLKDLKRGGLNAGKTGIGTPTFAQCWGLDASGNWANFRQDNTGSGSWDLNQSRTSNTVNEITGVVNSAGAAWIAPVYNPAGNVTTMPQPATPASRYVATYDAWNRLVQLTDGTNVVGQYQYDGLSRRTVKNKYSGGVLLETRHYYYSAAWQVLEERVGTSTSANRQFVWGLRYLDDLILRDRDTTGRGTLNERLYALQDLNWNLTALADTSGAVQERYSYNGYGLPAVLTPGFGVRSSSSSERIDGRTRG